MKTLLRSSALMAVTTALFLGCISCGDSTGKVTVDPATRVPTSQHAIKGGQVDRQNTSIVGIAIGRGGSRQGTCSGTLIAPNLVLTAQHCVSNLRSSRVICGRSQFGSKKSPSSLQVTTDTYMYRQNPTYYDVESIHVPRGSSAMCGRDIALLTLRNDIPSSVTKPITPRVNAPVQRGESYTAIGYGLDGRRGGSGIRRVLGGRSVRDRQRRTVRYDNGSKTVRKTVYEIQGSSGTCQGDSGGGAIDSQGRVIGALSRGRAGCRSAIYSGVYSWRGWIRDVARQAARRGNYQVPGWVNPNGGSTGGSTSGGSTGSSTSGGSTSGSGSTGGSTGGSGTTAKTCKEVFDCINNCSSGDQQCVNACYNDGSSTAQNQYSSLSQCYSNNCSSYGGGQRCLEYYCQQELDACMSSGESGGSSSGGTTGSSSGGSSSGSTSGSSSTGGSSGGSTSGSASTGGSTGGSSAGPQTCNEINTCKGNCPQGDDQCSSACYNDAASGAKQKWADLVRCYQNNCANSSYTNQCLQYYCRTELRTCLE